MKKFLEYKNYFLAIVILIVISVTISKVIDNHYVNKNAEREAQNAILEESKEAERESLLVEEESRKAAEKESLMAMLDEQWEKQVAREEKERAAELERAAAIAATEAATATSDEAKTVKYNSTTPTSDMEAETTYSEQIVPEEAPTVQELMPSGNVILNPKKDEDGNVYHEPYTKPSAEGETTAVIQEETPTSEEETTATVIQEESTTTAAESEQETTPAETTAIVSEPETTTAGASGNDWFANAPKASVTVEIADFELSGIHTGY